MEKSTAVFAVADNQRGLGERLEELGAVYNIGDWKDARFEAIKRALGFKPDKRALRGLVNRDGARLCAETILNLLGHRI
jgi:hypothetical protein